MDVSRFVSAHKKSYLQAYLELKTGKKMGHWMWYIFPQIQGLGFSETAEYYAVKNIEEAKTYMHHPILQTHMIELCSILLELNTNDAHKVFGSPDDLKLHSSMTLFAIACPEYDIFQKVIDKYYDGDKDDNTIVILEDLEDDV